MLHEILLSLSGHPSALFKDSARSESKQDSFPLLSPPEKALLFPIGNLARRHRALRTHAATISSVHPSTICRAVAASISFTHLARFQQKILDVESQILRKDAAAVGAYNIVPLAGVVGQFDEWTRLMEWLWEMSCYMLPEEIDRTAREEVRTVNACTGAGIIDKLRQEAQTGYPDIEAAATELVKVAETAWLKQLSTWVLYGHLPAYGGTDFFIHADEDAAGSVPEFHANSKLLPKFVSPQAASSVLFIGKSLNQIRSHRNNVGPSNGRSSTASELELVTVHLQHLSALSSPISSTSFSDAISAIRVSLSRNTLQQLLPLPKILQVLTLLKEFFLLGRGEFAMALITEANEQLRSRHGSSGQSRQFRPNHNLQGLLIKEGEVTAVLMRTWAVLSSYAGDEDITDDILDLARDTVHLSISRPTNTRPATPGRAREDSVSLPKVAGVAFNDILMTMPINLNLDIPSPMDLFISSSELDIYSAIHAYLLAIRRAHFRLADLWRQSHLRRIHPAPPGPAHCALPSGRDDLRKRRQRVDARALALRKVWATCSAAIFLLAETAGYFEGEVIEGSWKHFHHWVTAAQPTGGSGSRPQTSSSLNHSTMSTRPLSAGSYNASQRGTRGESAEPAEETPHDPEALASAHRRFLAALLSSLLLVDNDWTRTLRTLLSHVDELVAFFTRLQTIQQNLDLEEDEGLVDALTNHAEEEKQVALELDRSRKRVDSDLQSLVARLRIIDTERLGSGGLHVKPSLREDSYEPWRCGGVDRLLMKLDFGSSVADDEEDTDKD
ncbi:hypothetical protein H2201_000364 [Coniosporium apollinis]|uniref:Spindle pole body component n=1 Tax=Coniosporium apollinis TaxID=61459 RepID=A0ABQ9P4G8_9PEZI|nr:hypothetical protein H2201_000364 [Coniosporium apollinis]